MKIHDAKLDALESIVEELNGAPLLVAYQYKHDLARLKKKFPHGVALGKGKQGNKDMEAWNRGEIPIMFAHPASAALFAIFRGLLVSFSGVAMVR